MMGDSAYRSGQQQNFLDKMNHEAHSLLKNKNVSAIGAPFL
jgi:hypothetical protein